VLVPHAVAGRPTLADVAHTAGVSPATVSRVLTGSTPVTPDTRARVEQAVAVLGYVRNRAPRSGRPARADALALVICEETARAFADPYFAQLLRSITAELAPTGFQLVVLTVHVPRDYRTAVRYLRSGHVDGALVVSMHSRHRIDFGDIGIPVVLNGRPIAGADNVCYVDADNAGGAEAAVRYLLRAGRGPVATVAGPPDMAVGVDRLRGYHAAITDAGLSDSGLIAYGDFGQASAEHAVGLLLDRRPGIGAIFAASDIMAVGVLRALRKAGRRVPDDVAVVGFDDLPLAARTDPQLTTVRQPIAAMGRWMARELITLVSDAGGGGPGLGRGSAAWAGRVLSHAVLNTELVVRRSA
jgi:DNA-binding LacI/PurR family transcriptional regulator